MEIGAVVGFKRERVRQIDELRKIDLFPHQGKESVVIHYRIAVFGGEKAILVGNNREIDVCPRVLEVCFVHVAEAVGRMVEGIFTDRVVELGGVSAGNVDAVVVLFPEEIADGQGLERAEGIAQRELIERVAFKVRLEAPREHLLRAEKRKLLERPALAFRHGVVAFEDAPQ